MVVGGRKGKVEYGQRQDVPVGETVERERERERYVASAFVIII